jgi:hypothetical protein
VYCRVEDGAMTAANDGKSLDKPLESCDVAFELLPSYVESPNPNKNEFFLKSDNVPLSLWSCTISKGEVYGVQLLAGRGTKAAPYTLDCDGAGSLADKYLDRAPSSHYAMLLAEGEVDLVVGFCELQGDGSYATVEVNNVESAPLQGTCHDMVLKGAQGVLPNGPYWFRSTDTQWGGERVFQSFCNLNQVKGKGFTLIAKFSSNQFCYYSSNWHTKEFNAAKSLDGTMPKEREYDTLNEAYSSMGVSGLYFTGYKNYDLQKASYIGFAKEAAPRQLMTSQSVAIKIYPHWDTWSTHFGNSRKHGPQFMRDGKWELATAPYRDGYDQRCRSESHGSTRKPSGCGQSCVFCFQAGDGNCCHPGCGHHDNDVSIGIGLSSAYCGGGDGGDCSTSGNWADSGNRVIVWGGPGPK